MEIYILCGYFIPGYPPAHFGHTENKMRTGGTAMEQMTLWLIALMAHWGYPVIGMSLLLTNVGVPVPSELILGFAGYLVFAGQLQFAAVIMAALIGEITGACLAYALGYYGGTTFILRYGRMLAFSRRKLETSRRLFRKYGMPAIFFGRLLPVARGLIAIPAGFMKLDFTVFFLCTGFSSVIWVVVLVYMGQMFGENWRQVGEVGRSLGKTVFVLVLFGVGAYLLRRRRPGRSW